MHHCKNLSRFNKLTVCVFIQAGKANARSTIDPGFNYCKGLYEWYVLLFIGNVAKRVKKRYCKLAS